MSLGGVRSSHVPDLRSASVVNARSFRVRDAWRCNRFSSSPFYRPYLHGYAYPFGFSFGLSFGYPYYGGYYGYWNDYWAPCHSVYVAYPFVGYYYSYPYPYLSSYSGYNCDFYDGYYVRFGRLRTSYYVACSGYGGHAWDHHHCHFHSCSAHGSHYYHVRDCSLCYPEGDTYVSEDLQVPDASDEEVVTSPTESPAPLSQGVLSPAALPAEAPDSSVGGAAEVSGAAATVRRISPPLEDDAKPADRQEAFFASLKPAQLSFALGLVQFKNGSYDEASESLYNASIEDPESKLIKVFLGVSLFAVGEYSYAADYLRLGLEEWPAFPSYRWSVQGLYGNATDLSSQLALLEDEARRNPSNEEAALVLAFLGMTGASPASTPPGESLDRARSLLEDPVDHAIVERYVAEIEARSGLAPTAERDLTAASPSEIAEDPAIPAFLASLNLRDIPALPIR